MIILRINNMDGYRTKSLYMRISSIMEEKFMFLSFLAFVIVIMK